MKCKKWLFSKNVRFRFHSLLIENIENEFGFSFFLTLSMLLAFLFFLAIVLIFPFALKDKKDVAQLNDPITHYYKAKAI